MGKVKELNTEIDTISTLHPAHSGFLSGHTLEGPVAQTT